MCELEQRRLTVAQHVQCSDWSPFEMLFCLMMHIHAGFCRGEQEQKWSMKLQMFRAA